MQWRDSGLILGARRFGESGLILDVLTASRGRRSGLVHGGSSRRKRAQYEAGNTLDLAWSGRLEDQLGRFETAEATMLHAARHLDNPAALNAISSMTDLLRQSVDEGDMAGSAVFAPSLVLLDTLDNPEVWPALYVRWELGLLSALGFGLDLEQCTLSGAKDGLSHVSPRTGRAVIAEEAGDYVHRLLPLPAFLLDPAAEASLGDISDGLNLTGHFLEDRLLGAVHRGMPPSRQRLVSRLMRPRPAP
jgi:DNA repair protein RecO (recombination protein O)